VSGKDEPLLAWRMHGVRPNLREEQGGAMADVFLEPKHIHISSNGTIYTPRVCGSSRADGTWEAWIEFRPAGGGPIRATDRESTQPNAAAIEYWAGGLEPVYYEGAFARAIELSARVR
jgi:hypothetical protein